MKVETILQRKGNKVLSLRPEDTIQTKMHNGRFRHIPVVNDGKLLGVVSQGDVMHMCIEKAQTEASVMRELAIARG